MQRLPQQGPALIITADSSADDDIDHTDAYIAGAETIHIPRRRTQLIEQGNDKISAAWQYGLFFIAPIVSPLVPLLPVGIAFARFPPLRIAPRPHKRIARRVLSGVPAQHLITRRLVGLENKEGLHAVHVEPGFETAPVTLHADIKITLRLTTVLGRVVVERTLPTHYAHTTDYVARVVVRPFELQQESRNRTIRSRLAAVRPHNPTRARRRRIQTAGSARTRRRRKRRRRPRRRRRTQTRTP